MRVFEGMLAVREAHEVGASCVNTDGCHVITGGADGVVALFPVKRWPRSTSLWARQCHEQRVTAVVLNDAAHIALSCGRDGKVMLHENVHDSAASTSRLICQVTGEVRCLYFDTKRRRVFVGGDSLRCLHMNGTRFMFQVIPLVVPHPIVAVALSPCGHLLAMASASGAVGVVCPTSPPAATPESQTQEATALVPEELSAAYEKYKNVRFVFPNVLPARAKRDDGCTFRMQWCRTAAALFLCVPTVTEALVYKLDEKPILSMRSVGGLHCGDLTDLHSVHCYPITAHRMMCVMASREGLHVAKVDDTRLSVARVTSQAYEEAVTDVVVNEASGDIVVGLESGRVSLLHKAAVKVYNEAKAAAKAGTAAPELKLTAKGGNGDASKRATAGPSVTIAQPSTNEADDEEDSIHSNSGSESEFESSTEASVDGEGSDATSESLDRVVLDLKSASKDYLARDDVTGTTSREVRRRASSRFLDQEAEEASDGDAESEDAAAFADNGYGECREDLDEGNTRGEGYGEDLDSTSGAGGEHHPPVGRGGTLVAEDYSFQVGATPAGDEGSCFLAYNSVGYIHAARDVTTIYFHDISNPAVRILEKGTVVMGTLSPVGAGFVVAPLDATGDSIDEAPRLVIYFRTFVALGTQSEWRVRLQPGEMVRCMTAGVRYLAVATTRYLRLFSLSGLELAVLTKHPRIVTMVGTSSRRLMGNVKAEFDPLAIFFLDGGALRMEVLDVGSRSTVIAPQAVPLSEQQDGTTHQLQWVGWSEDGPLHAADTAGVVRMYTQSWGGAWVPVFDPRQLPDQYTNLWIWAVNDERLSAYRSPKTAPAYPVAVATGLPTEHQPLFLPLTRAPQEKDAVVWDHVLRRQLRADELKRQSPFYSAAIAKYDALHDKRILELFSGALSDQLTTRAFDLATMLELRDNVEVCAKEANSRGHMQLVQSLLNVFERRVLLKQRRRCALPLEGATMTEKERDGLLRRLLAREKAGGGGTSMAQAAPPPPSTPIAAQETTPAVRPAAAPKILVGSTAMATTPMKATPERCVSPPQHQRRGVSPAKSLATTVTSAAVDHSPADRRHVTFDMSQRPTAAVPTAALPMTSKPLNPFRKETNHSTVSRVRRTTPTTSGSTTGRPSPPRTTLSSYRSGASRATTVTPPTIHGSPTTPIAAPAPDAVSSRVMILGEVEDDLRSDDEASVVHVATTATPSRVSRAAATDTAPSPPSAGVSLQDTPGPPKPPITHSHHLHKGGGFVATALPTATPPLSPAVVTAETPLDPFLSHATAHDGVLRGRSPVTVAQVLLDVGHEHSQGGPRSASFGEALRKRYREDDEAEEEDDEGGSLAIPHIHS